jgi:hypothetical protein
MDAIQRTCFIGFLLAASPAIAAIDPIADPAASRVFTSLQRTIPAPEPLPEQGRDETRETSLPLECRGFNLQQTRPALSRCN